MSKSYFFLGKLQDIPALRTTPVLPDVYCPTGGYKDASLDKTFTSRGEKYRYLRQHGMREASMTKPGQPLGGTEGCAKKRRGSRGNFGAKPTPRWVQHV